MKKLLKELLINVYYEQKKTSKETVKSNKDIVTECDLAISKLIQEEIFKWNYPLEIASEESSDLLKNCSTPEYKVFIDELDGTDNAYRNIDQFPSVTLIQIAKINTETVKFQDFILVGAIEHSSATIYLAQKNSGLEKYQINNDKSVTQCALISKHPKQSVIIVDNYSMMNEPEILINIISKYQSKDFGASSASYLWVAEGLFEGYASSHKKGHELPLLYLMCRENNILMTDFAGNSYDNISYDFNSVHYQVIAGIESVHKKLVNSLKKYSKQL